MTFLKRVDARFKVTAYKIEDLDEEEYETLCWLSDRGYDGGILDSLDGEQKEDGGYSFKPIPENKAWEIKQAIDDDRHAFLTSNGSESLAEKLNKFLNNIV